MSRKYQVTDSRGKVHKRTTKNRTYHFAVVHHIRSYESKWRPGEIYPASSGAEWAARRDLAENVARRWQRYEHCEAIEIIEVQQPPVIDKRVPDPEDDYADRAEWKARR